MDKHRMIPLAVAQRAHDNMSPPDDDAPEFDPIEIEDTMLELVSDDSTDMLEKIDVDDLLAAYILARDHKTTEDVPASTRALVELVRKVVRESAFTDQVNDRAEEILNERLDAQAKAGSEDAGADRADDEAYDRLF